MRTAAPIAASLILLPVVSCASQQAEELTDYGPAQDVESTAESTEELLKDVTCRKDDRGATCMMRCAAESLFCAGGRSHPYKPNAGTGLLGKCNMVGRDTACWYYWKAGDKCRFIVGKNPICGYPGGDN